MPGGGVGGTVTIPFRIPMNAAPIGIFDSGIGGLTVARAIYERLPARVHRLLRRYGPGALRPQVARDGARYSLEILDWLLGQGVKAVVIACNTSTAHALDALQKHSPVPVIGVIEPGARAAGAAWRRGPIGVIGTAGTIASNAYARAIQRSQARGPGRAAAMPPLRAAGRGRVVRPPRG